MISLASSACVSNLCRMRKKLPKSERRGAGRLVFYVPPRSVPSVKAAAKEAGKSVSSYVSDVVLAEVRRDDLSSRLLSSPALRGALSEVMSRPDVLHSIADKLRVATPAQLELFKVQMGKAWRANRGGEG